MSNTEMNNRNVEHSSSQIYVLGHSDQELARLNEQHRIVEPITRRFFLEAGLAPGMRVLDVGSGAGDVSFLASDLVGDTGIIASAPARAKPTHSAPHATMRPGNPEDTRGYQPTPAPPSNAPYGLYGTCSPVLHFGFRSIDEGVLPYCGG
jgi:hypothetical protein